LRILKVATLAAASGKRQAASGKRQAASGKRQAASGNYNVVACKATTSNEGGIAFISTTHIHGGRR
jgi:hypothetical protein